MKDYYSLLGIESTATKAEIKKNYRILATKFHPDKSKDPDAESKFVEITEAYDVLSNQKSRTLYDLRRWQLLKDKQNDSDLFTTVVPPKESLRQRRNKAQEKRSTKYNQAKNAFSKFWYLSIESLHICSRYVLHMLGTSILALILNSVIAELTFQDGVRKGIALSILIGFIIYCIFRIAQHNYKEFNSDVKTFSTTYNLNANKAAFFTLSTYVLLLTIYILFLQHYF